MKFLGFENLPVLAIFLSFFALFAALFCLWKLKKMSRLQKIFFSGKNGQDLENLIFLLEQRLKNLENESLLNSQIIKNLQKTLSFTVQKIGVVRYSPFADGGGSYSFSLALLNAQDSGVIITNMYGRQQSRVYTKKITGGKSEMPLTEEEAKAISIANNNQNQRLE